MSNGVGRGTSGADTPPADALPLMAENTGQPRAVLSVLAAAGIVSPLLFTVGFVTQGFLRTDFRSGYNPIAQQISDLTAGPFGWVQQVNFVVFGLLLIVFAAGLVREVRKVWPWAVGPALVGWNGVELVIAGLFPLHEDATGQIVDPLGVHMLNGTIFFLSIGIVLAVLSRQLARDERWRDRSAYTLVSGIVVFAMVLLNGLLAERVQAPLHAWLGLIQRLTLAVWFPCLIVLALRLRRLARTGGRQEISLNTAGSRGAEVDTNQPERRFPPSTPLWVRVFGIITIGASLLFLGMMLADMVGMQNMNGMSGMGSSPSRYLPLWVEVSGFLALVVVLLGFIALLVGVGGKTRDPKVSRTVGRRTRLMSQAWRKLTLTTHIAASVGWIGAITGFLALTVVELSSQNVLMVRGTLLSMNVIAWFIIVPLSLASLLTGLILALFTRWGLLRHYWVLAKLLINLLASIIVLMYVQALGSLANMAAASTVSGAELLSLRGIDSVLHSGAALLALLVATALSVYKPRGMTRYGQRKQNEQRQGGVQALEASLTQAVAIN